MALNEMIGGVIAWACLAWPNQMNPNGFSFFFMSSIMMSSMLAKDTLSNQISPRVKLISTNFKIGRTYGGFVDYHMEVSHPWYLKGFIVRVLEIHAKYLRDDVDLEFNSIKVNI